MFKYLWRHICRFLKLDQMDQAGPSVNILDKTSTQSIDAFFVGICEVPIQVRSKYHVKELTWYKQSNGSQHEFVVAKLTNSTYLKVDREPSSDANPLQISSTSSASSLDSKSIPADDGVQIISRNSRKHKKIVSSKHVTTVCEYTFTTFPVLEFSRILVTLSNSEPHYTITGKMCYWYASRIVALSTQMFNGIESKKTNGLGGQWMGILKFNDETGLDDIMGRYIQARDADPEPIGPVLRLVTQVADEYRRRADEAEHKADAERLLREKAELELERYKAMAGHREGH